MSSLTTASADFLREQIKALDAERAVLQAALDVLAPPPKLAPVQPNETRKLLAPAKRPKRKPLRDPISPDDVLALVHSGVTKPSEIGARLGGAHYMTVTHTLRALAKDGQVKFVEKGKWVEVNEHNWTEYRAGEL